MAQPETALVTRRQEEAHRRDYNHGFCCGCRLRIEGAGAARSATYVDVSLAGGVVVRYHPRCAPPVERWMRASGLGAPLMGTHTVAPACALVDRHEDFVTPFQIVALLTWADAKPGGSRRAC
jgi:hypothetical protein